jgi:hypothetical protein
VSDGEILTRQIVTVEEGEAKRREWEALDVGFPSPGVRRTVSPVKVIELEVSGAEPVIAGWRFVASIDHDTERNLVSQVPGPDNPVRVSEWIEAPPSCDHCKLFRYRLRTYVLENVESGELRQVGSTCIEDYLGGQTAAQIARLAELWVAIDLTAGSDRDEDWAPGQRGEAGWLRSDVLAQAAAIIRRIGFTSKKAADNHPGLASTATLTVSAGLNWRPTRQEPQPPFPVEQEDADLATKVTEWVEGLEPRPEQDYLWNLQTAVGRPLTTLRTMGLVVSAISAFDRELAWKARKEVERLEARPVPVTNSRVTVSGKVLTTKLVETDYGVTEKMLVQVAHDGGAYKLWGTIPKSINFAFTPDCEVHGTSPQGGERGHYTCGCELAAQRDLVSVGATVTFTAKVERSRDDEAFGFFSRPTKASAVPALIEKEEAA